MAHVFTFIFFIFYFKCTDRVLPVFYISPKKLILHKDTGRPEPKSGLRAFDLGLYSAQLSIITLR